MPSVTSAPAVGAFVYVCSSFLQGWWDATSPALVAGSAGDCSPIAGANTFEHEGRCYHNAADGRCRFKANGFQLYWYDGSPEGKWCWGGLRTWEGKKAVNDFTIRQLMRWAAHEPQHPNPGLAAAVTEAVGTLQNPSLRAEDAASACGRLGELFHQTYAAEWMIEAGAVDAVIAAARKMPDDKTVVKLCVGAMAAMCADWQFVQHASRAGVGGLELLGDVWRRWPEDPAMLPDDATMCFVQHGDTNRVSWRHNRGVELTLQAARAHARDPETLARVLSVLAADNTASSAERFIQAGGLEFAGEAIRAHPPPKGGRVRELALQTVRTALYERELRGTLAAGSYISDVIQAMRGAPGDYYTLSPACSSLYLLCQDNSTYLAQAIQEGAPLAALSAVVGYPDTADTFSWARSPEFTMSPTREYEDCLHFLNLAMRDCGARQALKDAGAIEAISTSVVAGESKISRRIHGGQHGVENPALYWRGWLELLRSKLREGPCAEE